MATDRPRYTISVTDELLEEIDDFRFGNRFATRSAATAELLRLGLQVVKEQKAKEDKRG